MPEINRVSPGPITGNPAVREAVAIHAQKVYDSCRDKECLRDLRVYPTRSSQLIIDKAINIRPKKAELLWVFIDVEPISFNRGCYTVDAKFFYKITKNFFFWGFFFFYYLLIFPFFLSYSIFKKGYFFC